ncbi:hypothetical protein GCM10012275_04610 [Longimycelium tulufanense]|uniref:Uncharacterized protein n=1 Tax=Longimycelium tulufanense TaxID=907463 RepID=A0A8J3FTR8_9PSEU|nr:hypothetical protein [Longimycelium tulufanense]GGM36465.1 hypothetical protein GCM10012275_04610 [Longimycelium tulufanense]
MRASPGGVGVLAARVLAVAAVVLTLVGLYGMPWWSDETFLEFRHHHLHTLVAGARSCWDEVSASYYRFGFLVHTGLVLVPPLVVTRRDRWHWLTVGTLLAAGWQLAGVRAAARIEPGWAPSLGTMAALLVVVAWWLGHTASRPGGWRL